MIKIAVVIKNSCEISIIHWMKAIILTLILKIKKQAEIVKATKKELRKKIHILGDSIVKHIKG